jgi:catechol-2,3-dioxygenase
MARSADPLSRRDFNCLLALSALGLAAPARQTPTSAAPTRGIFELSLLAADLKAQQRFYHQTLGCPVVREGAEQITIQAGGTRLIFRQARPEQGRPMYHFAFNIPENKLDLARRWLHERTPVIVKDGREVFHYPSWNAHSVYFYDPAGNIVEFIARHNLANATPGPFSQREILYASEIGLVVDDLEREVAALRSRLGLDVYRTGAPDLVPVGDEHRLLIVVLRGRKWFQTTPATVHPTAAKLAGKPPTQYQVAGFPYELSLA